MNNLTRKFQKHAFASKNGNFSTATFHQLSKTSIQVIQENKNKTPWLDLNIPAYHIAKIASEKIKKTNALKKKKAKETIPPSKNVELER